MSASYMAEITQFCIEGRFIDFVIKDGYKLKGLLLRTSEGEYYIKLAKHLRTAFDLRLPPGTWLQVMGTKKSDYKNDKVTLKAERVMAANAQGIATTVTPSEKLLNEDYPQVKSRQTKTTILVCQKSDCMRRGGQELCQAMERALRDRHLEDQVTIRGTGCMKNCKAGPNLVMPDKTKYSRIQAAQVSVIIDRHFGDVIQPSELNSPVNVAINMEHLAKATI